MRAPPEALFEYIPDEPVAAASLAQVYRARVRGGLEVAVKLQRPGLAQSVALDATILRSAAIALRRVVRLRSDVVGIVDELIGRIFDEMDYRPGLQSFLLLIYGLTIITCSDYTAVSRFCST